MHDTPRYLKEVQRILADLESDDNQGTAPPDIDTPEQVIDMYIEDFAEEERITLIRKKPSMPTTSDDERDLPDRDTAPLQPQPTPTAGSGIVPFALFVLLLCLFCLAVQVNFLVHPFSVTVSLEARSRHVALTGTVPLGRVLNPITLSQSSTVQATGHGHQDAKRATGTITFYNGQFASVTIPASILITSASGIAISTDQEATIPAANPPLLGQVTVSAHASSSGTAGNIAAYDINQVCCAPSVKAVNTTAFSGGQDARDYPYVQKSDIQTAATPLQATVSQSITGALQGQVTAHESFATPSCSTSTTSDHQVGQEASQAKVTVSETCSAVAYNAQKLMDTVTQLLTTQAATKLGNGYGLLEPPQITVTQATPGKQVTLAFTSVSTWVYGISSDQQRRIKASIAGKNTQEALKVLRSLPGIGSASVAFSGFGDSSRIPKDTENIHIVLFVA
jgi:hypothetical protein